MRKIQTDLMKETKIPYFDGKKLTYTYEYRGFKYSKEFKKMLKEYAIKVKRLIDNFLDKDIYRVTIEDAYYIRELTFKHINNELVIVQGKIKKESYDYKN